MAKNRHTEGAGPSQRQLRVGELIRRTLSSVLARGDVHDPELNAMSITVGEDQGLIKTIFDAKTGELLGAHMVGAEVTELIQGYVVGKTMETTEEDLMHTIFPHPTLSEMMHESVLDAYGQVIHY